MVPIPLFSFGTKPVTSPLGAGSDQSTSPAICASPSPSGSFPPFHAPANSAKVPTVSRAFRPRPFFFRPRNKPPCSTKVLSPICAANGRDAPTFMNCLHSPFPSRFPYFTCSSFLYPYTSVQNSHSWLPRSRKTKPGAAAFHAKTTANNSAPHAPRSTKSPLNTYQFFDDGSPAMLMSFSASCSCPCVSPTTTTSVSVGGASFSKVGSKSNKEQACFINFSCTALGNTLARCLGGSPDLELASSVRANKRAHSMVITPSEGHSMTVVMGAGGGRGGLKMD
mmetsp:Transcript_4577/g.16964  ORF Transcript_4577/g.16964 Transcript_4577/m.16964 type:complete len:280 (+) Transcript_4577:821-1660(+)